MQFSFYDEVALKGKKVLAVWDFWLGPAAMRPYLEGACHQFNWRTWNDLGTGALVDIAYMSAPNPAEATAMIHREYREGWAPPSA